jgi:hypothetical protein
MSRNRTHGNLHKKGNQDLFAEASDTQDDPFAPAVEASVSRQRMSEIHHLRKSSASRNLEDNMNRSVAQLMQSRKNPLLFSPETSSEISFPVRRRFEAKKNDTMQKKTFIPMCFKPMFENIKRSVLMQGGFLEIMVYGNIENNCQIFENRAAN